MRDWFRGQTSGDGRVWKTEPGAERGLEERVRDRMARELRQNLARCRRVILDENLDLKTRERWTQLYNNTSQILNQLLKDRQMRDWEKRLREIEKYRGIPGRTGRPQMVPPEPETAKPEK